MKKTFFEFLGRLFFILPKSPKTIQIEITNICNLNCRMCPRRFLNVEEKHMDFEVFKKIVDNSKGVKEIILTGWGEPLCHPQISQAVKYCKDSGFQTRLTTNGTLLTDRLAQKLIGAGLNVITFSLESLTSGSNDFGHMVRNQVENIENLAQKKNRPKIIIQTTIHLENEKNIFEIISFSKKINSSIVNLARIDNKINSELKRPNFKQESGIVKRAVKFGDEMGVVVNCFHHTLGKGFFRIFFKRLKGILHLKGKYCLKLYNEAYVNLRGELTPCCNLPGYKIGSVLSEPVSVIWKNKKLHYFRKNWRKICQGCDSGQIEQL